MDPVDASHLLTAGTQVHETTDGAANWTTVYDLGTRTQPGDPAAEPRPRAIPTTWSRRSTCAARARRCRAGGKPTAELHLAGRPGHRAGRRQPGRRRRRARAPTPTARSRSRPTRPTARRRSRSRWADGTNDWDLVVFRREGDTLKVVGSSAQGAADDERAGRARAPGAGRVRDPRPQLRGRGQLHGRGHVRAGRRRRHRGGRERGVRRLLRLLRRAQHHAVHERARDERAARRQLRQARRARQLAHRRAARGCPKRYITSVQMDPADARTVYVTLAGYSRRWLRPGVLGPDEGADVGGGHVYKSTDAGETLPRRLRQPAGHPGELRDRPQRPARGRHRPRRVHLGRTPTAARTSRSATGLPARAGVLARAQAQGERGGAGHADRGDAGPWRVPLRVRRAGQARRPRWATSPRRPRSRSHASGRRRAATARSRARRAVRSRRRARAAPGAALRLALHARASRGR